MKTIGVSITKDVAIVKRLASGYIRVDAGGRQFAQMPNDVWGSLNPGDTVPDEWAFEPEWCRLRKPLTQAVGLAKAREGE